MAPSTTWYKWLGSTANQLHQYSRINEPKDDHLFKCGFRSHLSIHLRWAWYKTGFGCCCKYLWKPMISVSVQCSTTTYYWAFTLRALRPVRQAVTSCRWKMSFPQKLWVFNENCSSNATFRVHMVDCLLFWSFVWIDDWEKFACVMSLLLWIMASMKCS